MDSWQRSVYIPEEQRVFFFRDMGVVEGEFHVSLPCVQWCQESSVWKKLKNPNSLYSCLKLICWDLCRSKIGKMVTFSFTISPCSLNWRISKWCLITCLFVQVLGARFEELWTGIHSAQFKRTAVEWAQLHDLLLSQLTTSSSGKWTNMHTNSKLKGK